MLLDKSNDGFPSLVIVLDVGGIDVLVESDPRLGRIPAVAVHAVLAEKRAHRLGKVRGIRVLATGCSDHQNCRQKRRKGAPKEWREDGTHHEIGVTRPLEDKIEIQVWAAVIGKAVIGDSVIGDGGGSGIGGKTVLVEGTPAKPSMEPHKALNKTLISIKP